MNLMVNCGNTKKFAFACCKFKLYTDERGFCITTNGK